MHKYFILFISALVFTNAYAMKNANKDFSDASDEIFYDANSDTNKLERNGLIKSQNNSTKLEQDNFYDIQDFKLLDNQKIKHEISPEVYFNLQTLCPVLWKIISANQRGWKAHNFDKPVKLDFSTKLMKIFFEILASKQENKLDIKIEQIIENANLKDQEKFDLYLEANCLEVNIPLLFKNYVKKLHEHIVNKPKGEIELVEKEQRLRLSHDGRQEIEEMLKKFPKNLACEIAKQYYYQYGDANVKLPPKEFLENIVTWSSNKDEIGEIRDSQFLDIGIDYGFSIQELKDNNKLPELNDQGELDLSHLRINSLEGLSNIENIQKIKSLKLNNNLINKLESRAFNELNNLKSLNLRNNKICNINDDVFKSLSNLEYLNLSHNLISRLLPNGFIYLHQLKDLHLNDNEIFDIFPGAFNGLQNTTILSLQNNQIKLLQACVFKELQSLKVLMLDNNIINSINASVFLGLKNLTVLGLSENQLRYLNLEIFKVLSEDGMIDLTWNRLENPQIIKMDLKKILPKITIYIS